MSNTKITFAEIQQTFRGHYISYPMLLKTAEWHERREQIIKRDKQKCTKCGKWATSFIDSPSAGKYKPDCYWVDADNAQYFDDLPVTLYKPASIFGLNAKWTEFGTSHGYIPMIYADKSYHLEVHHKYYLQATVPWKYNDDALTTLCNWCHRETHARGAQIPIYLNQVLRDAIFYQTAGAPEGVTYYTPCIRCDGTGTIPSFDHIQKGVCFRCGGAGYDELKDFRLSC